MVSARFLALKVSCAISAAKDPRQTRIREGWAVPALGSKHETSETSTVGLTKATHLRTIYCDQGVGG